MLRRQLCDRRNRHLLRRGEWHRDPSRHLGPDLESLSLEARSEEGSHFVGLNHRVAGCGRCRAVVGYDRCIVVVADKAADQDMVLGRVVGFVADMEQENEIDTGLGEEGLRSCFVVEDLKSLVVRRKASETEGGLHMGSEAEEGLRTGSEMEEGHHIVVAEGLGYIDFGVGNHPEEGLHSNRWPTS